MIGMMKKMNPILLLTQLFVVAFTGIVSLMYIQKLKAKAALKDSESKAAHKRLLGILDGLDAGVFVSDMDTCEILFANKHAWDQFGDVVGQRCWQALHNGRAGSCDICSNAKLCKPNAPEAGERAWVFQKNINERWYTVHAQTVSWWDGRIARLEMVNDITDRRCMEAELRQTHKEIQAFYKIIKQADERKGLDSLGPYLLKEFRAILETEHVLLVLFHSDGSSIFSISGKNIVHIADPELVHTTQTRLREMGKTLKPDGITIAAPLLPVTFPANGRQTVIPIHHQNQLCGALVAAFSTDNRSPEKTMEKVSLILEQAAGAIMKAVLHEEELRELFNPIDLTDGFRGIIGRDHKMQLIYKVIKDIAPSDASVLIQGESGTGKELVARAIHHQSPRKNNPFIIINCSAYPETLLESELFGYEKGAFTGAIRQKIGRFEQAHGGTVFLDEIGEISPSAQIKLLRVLQTHQFERVGGEQTLSVDVRILAATNKDLIQEIKSGHFREDLYYRLNVIPIHLPALKTRRNDIPLLARHFLQKFSAEQKLEVRGFSSDAMRCLLEHHWPGNVRELENSIEHAVVIAKGEKIEISHLPTGLSRQAALLAGPAHSTILENEKRLLMEILQACTWNKKQAAQQLGISRSTLYIKLKKYQIAMPTPRVVIN